MVELAVKAAKNILHKTEKAAEDPHLAILTLRNTPQHGIDLSPAQMLLGHRTRTLMPTCSSLRKPRIDEDTWTRLKLNKERQKYYYNRTARDLKPLEDADIGRLQP